MGELKPNTIQKLNGSAQLITTDSRSKNTIGMFSDNINKGVVKNYKKVEMNNLTDA
jgi:hypothetical protein